MKVCGYRLEFKPGDYCFYSPEEYKQAEASGNANADVYPLYTAPVVGGGNEPVVWRGERFYLGLKLKAGVIDEAVLAAFQIEPSNYDEANRELARFKTP